MTELITKAELTAIKTDSYARETLRRQALWAMTHRERRAHALACLDLIERLDYEVPIGEAATWTLGDVARLVPVSRRDNPPFEVVRLADIPEPWRSRMGAASIGSTMSCVSGYYVDDWRTFLRLWRREHEQLHEYRLDRS